MASKRMLVDATHPEETRVTVVSGNRLEEFDFESATRRQLRGNIYLAKVTRVEPSLQAAFVDYGGNRHGFLAFSEIHPDYYQIPAADREALKRDELAEDEEAARAEDEQAAPKRRRRRGKPAAKPAESADAGESEDKAAASEDGLDADTVSEPVAADTSEAPENADNGSDGDSDAEESVEDVGAGDAMEEMPRRRVRKARSYKIQEVIKRRQVLLVQVVKEERGNKGAALTTYLSLAGRYSVLMPNTARGGGISRKITGAADRKRLKDIASELDVPREMGVILRTAGASRTKAEVKRDFEYLLRLWENVRELTLGSTAPALVYEEGSLIKRSIRDLYNKDIAEVLVAGDDAYKEAKDFMKMIMPSHARHVKPYGEDQPIFSRYSVEGQLDSMFSPRVTLPSGGYIIINPTEALVSIDVNSGKSTREHNIEDTALQTNLEAADEVARQLRLRDLAGLIVIDFIDMEEKRNNRTVERRIKDALKNDRARIQIGRISHFGLLEMSRQRIRFGVLEGSTHSCPHCAGTGFIRSTESIALMVMRAIEDNVRRRPNQSIAVSVAPDVALYILNSKRRILSELEGKYGLGIQVVADGTFTSGHFTIERRADEGLVEPVAHVKVDSAIPVDEEASDDEGSSNNRNRRRRGGRGRGRDREDRQQQDAASESEDQDESADNEAPSQARSEDGDEDGTRKRRRRGRRGGRRNRRNGDEDRTQDADASAEGTQETGQASEQADEPDAKASPEEDAEAKPRRARRTRGGRSKSDAADTSTEAQPAESEASEAPTEEKDQPAPAVAQPTEETSEAPAEEKSSRRRRGKREIVGDDIIVTSSTPANGADEDADGAESDKPKKGGWWQRGFFG